MLYRGDINPELLMPPHGQGCLRVKPTQKVQNPQGKKKKRKEGGQRERVRRTSLDNAI